MPACQVAWPCTRVSKCPGALPACAACVLRGTCLHYNCLQVMAKSLNVPLSRPRKTTGIPSVLVQVMPKYNAFKISKVPGGEKQDQSKAGIQTRALEVS